MLKSGAKVELFFHIKAIKMYKNAIVCKSKLYLYKYNLWKNIGLNNSAVILCWQQMLMGIRLAKIIMTMTLLKK